MEFVCSSSDVEKVRHQFVVQDKEKICSKVIDSPVGRLTLIANETALLHLRWGDGWDALGGRRIEKGIQHSTIEWAARELMEYFDGTRKEFSVPTDPFGTNFQRAVWRELQKIPFGTTINYGEQAKRLSNPKAARAVGAANGKNPIGIIIPCHRVIGASGHLTGFAGGLEVKGFLLKHEGIG